MSEEISNVTNLPKGHPDRDLVAAQIKQGRVNDREGRWTDNRVPEHYLFDFRGLAGTLGYARKYVQSNIVLDIGTGDSNGISTVARSKMGSGLEFRGTSLTHHQNVDKHLGRDKVILTPVETLRGIKDQSVGCILAQRSASYTTNPGSTIQNMDRVLAPGGIIKATFRGEDASATLNENRSDTFVGLWRELGYDVAVQIPTDSVEKRSEIVIAIKPSENQSHIASEQVMAADSHHLNALLGKANSA